MPSRAGPTWKEDLAKESKVTSLAYSTEAEWTKLTARGPGSRYICSTVKLDMSDGPYRAYKYP